MIQKKKKSQKSRNEEVLLPLDQKPPTNLHNTLWGLEAEIEPFFTFG